MGCSPFANYHFQMGVTVMGFAEDFGHSKAACIMVQPALPLPESLSWTTVVAATYSVLQNKSTFFPQHKIRKPAL